MIASLPMYDWPEVRRATDAWWAGLARHMAEAGFKTAPAKLDRATPVHDVWRSPDLLLSQTCGYPLMHAFKGQFALVGTPLYGVDGCQGSDYSSVVVVEKGSRFRRIGDLRGTRAVYNEPASMSGRLALQAVAAPNARDGRFFGEALVSGSHLRSMEMVAQGEADVAAIDCVSYALALEHRSTITASLRIIGRGPAAPSLPYVTSRSRSPAELLRLRRAVTEAAADPTLAEARRTLFIDGFVGLDLAAYDRIVQIEAQAHAQGYTSLS
jgi:ABC-type phosphate/phosphonate transport system substrate-binding protein